MTKREIVEGVKDVVQVKLDELLKALEKLQESMEGEEKSTAGDKYETARAMAQNEIDQLNGQIALTKQNLVTLGRLNPDVKYEEGHMGALIKLETRLLLISVAQGRISLSGGDVFAISPNSPIGQNLLGKKKGDSVKMGNKEERIIEIK